MTIAIPVWTGRVSPLFDEASQLLTVEIGNHESYGHQLRATEEIDLLERARKVATLGVEVLICSGISRQLELMLTHTGVLVVSGVCGSVEDVIDAVAEGRLDIPGSPVPGSEE